MQQKAVIKSSRAFDADAGRRISTFEWRDVGSQLSMYGNAILNGLLTGEECRALANMYSQQEHFRSCIHMARHGFGKGEY